MQKRPFCVKIKHTKPLAEVVELADAPDSKSGDGDIVRVQVPPSAPSMNNTNPVNSRFVFFFAKDWFGIVLF